MPTASTLEIVSTVGKLVTAISDVPALSVLKPIGGLLVTICGHVEALESNKEAAITLVERVNRAVEVLTNRAQNLDGVVPGNYYDDIKSLEDVLVKIAAALERSRQRKWYRRVLSPKADTAELNGLSSKLDYAIRMFGLAADFEARLTFQTLRAHLPQGGSELHGTTNNTLQVDEVLYETAGYSVQSGTYNKKAVVVKVYYPTQEERFAQDLRQRRKLIHPRIACVINGPDEVSIMLLCAENLLFCPQNTIDISSVRDPWKHQRIGPQIESGDMARQSTHRRSTSHPSPDTLEMMHAPFETLTIKESAALLQQFIGVVQFLGKMKVEVAWWEFKPSWVGLRGKNQLVLIDWDQETKSRGDEEFQPQYAIHVIGLDFSDIVPEAFQDSGRLLKEDLDSQSPGFMPRIRNHDTTEAFKLPEGEGITRSLVQATTSKTSVSPRDGAGYISYLHRQQRFREVERG